MPSGTDTLSFDDALRALEAPLSFAARGAFENLERVKDLEGTLSRAAHRALGLTVDPAARRRLQEVIALIPAPQAPRATRVAQLSKVQQALVDLRQVKAPAAQASPAATKPPVEPRPSKSVDKAPPSASPAAAPPPLDAPVQFVRHVGPRVAEMLAARGVKTVEDLLRFLPRRYQGRAGHEAIGSLQPGMVATVEGEVYGVSERNMRGRRSLEVILTDGTGALHLMWFRVPGGRSFVEGFAKGKRLRAAGEVKRFKNRLQIAHPEISRADVDDAEASPVEDAIVPLYLEIEGLRQSALRKIIVTALPSAALFDEPLSAALIKRRGLAPLAESIQNIHQPPASTSLDALQDMATPWHRRLIYEELLLLQLAVLRGKNAAAATPGFAVPLQMGLDATAATLFRFPLTGAQQRALGEIERDLRRSTPMQRLLQGDVGSGKTAVALSAAAAVARAGYQAAIMAPTELLAEQHARTALASLEPAGIRVGLLTGKLTAPERRQVLAGLQDGTVSVVVGTHAIIQEAVGFKALALGIVDEQHRFGVLQRARLVELGKAGLGTAPHVLVMTATPIPRTLALTVYGDLDLSLIDELPPGRTPIFTKLFRDRDRARVYSEVRRAVETGRQAYVVFPLVEESDKEGMDALHDATRGVEELGTGPLHGLRLGLLHGRLSSDEKDAVMRAFARHDLDVLVATTVIEVGIDVPNATVMVIEHAERFGLSQLHQLRGRVGRGAHASACYMVAYFRPSDDAWRRLAVMEETNDGFRIAEEDLAIRGPGDFVGTRQSGLPVLSLANLARDQELLIAARADAAAILTRDPSLRAAENASLARLFAQSWAHRLELAQIG